MNGTTLLQYEYKAGNRKSVISKKGLAEPKSYPIIVLMNKGSASAAEILAGALKQSADAVLVGDTTYGKGKVQLSLTDELGDGSLMKLTVYKWLLPDGVWIQDTGISPDVGVAQADYFLARSCRGMSF